MRKKFRKEERLCSKRDIDSLFHSGSSFIVYPFRVVYKAFDQDISQVKVILSVSKRKFRRAHDRNRIKRLMREVYRLQKEDLLLGFLNSSKSLNFAIQYVANEELSFELLSKKMTKLLSQLMEVCRE